MYHIKKDKRMLTSARMIAEALDKCMETKPFKDITVTEVLNLSTVSRATFYRLFDTTADVLSYQCDNAFEVSLKSIDSMDTSMLSTEEIIILFAKFWIDHSDFAEKIIASGYMHILYDSNQKYIHEILQTVYSEDSFTLSQSHYIAGSMSAILFTWIKEGKQETPENLVHSLHQVVNTLAKLLAEHSISNTD